MLSLSNNIIIYKLLLCNIGNMQYSQSQLFHQCHICTVYEAGACPIRKVKNSSMKVAYIYMNITMFVRCSPFGDACAIGAKCIKRWSIKNIKMIFTAIDHFEGIDKGIYNWLIPEEMATHRTEHKRFRIIRSEGVFFARKHPYQSECCLSGLLSGSSCLY
jgi:hypothetical protein